MNTYVIYDKDGFVTIVKANSEAEAYRIVREKNNEQ